LHAAAAAPTSQPDGSTRADRALPPPPTARRLRILCLHGYHGSAGRAPQPDGLFVAELEPLAELVFVDAPSLAAGSLGGGTRDRRARPASDDPGVDGRGATTRAGRGRANAIVARFAAEGADSTGSSASVKARRSPASSWGCARLLACDRRAPRSVSTSR